MSAWRRLCSLLVEHLDEPRSQHEVADLLAGDVDGITVRELFESLSKTIDGDNVLDAEGELRSRALRAVDVEIALLALAARRVDELEGATLRAYSPRPHEVLSPHWLKEYFHSRIDDPVPALVRDLAERLVDRAMRVALSKMQTRSGGSIWIPTRVKERDGILYRVSSEVGETSAYESEASQPSWPALGSSSGPTKDGPQPYRRGSDWLRNDASHHHCRSSTRLRRPAKCWR